MRQDIKAFGEAVKAHKDKCAQLVRGGYIKTVFFKEVRHVAGCSCSIKTKGFCTDLFDITGRKS